MYLILQNVAGYYVSTSCTVMSVYFTDFDFEITEFTLSVNIVSSYIALLLLLPLSLFVTIRLTLCYQ